MPRYPTAAGPVDPGWVQPTVNGTLIPKTTFDDPVAFLAEADSAIDHVEGGPVPDRTSRSKLGGDGRPLTDQHEPRPVDVLHL